MELVGDRLDSDKVAEALKALDSRPDMQEDLASGSGNLAEGLAIWKQP